MLIMPVVKPIRKALVEHVNFLVIFLCLSLAKSKTLLLFLLLKLSILLLVVVMFKSYGLNNNWVILVLLCIMFLSFVITQVPSISPRILFSTHAPSILRLGIILLEIMRLIKHNPIVLFNWIFFKTRTHTHLISSFFIISFPKNSKSIMDPS